MNKCEFVSGPGALKLYNPELGVGNKERPILRQNPILFNSQEVKIQLSGNTSSSKSTDFPIGSLMKQTATSSQGNVVAHLGHLGTITHQSGTGIGSFTMPAGTVEYLRKEYTQCIFASNAAVKGAKVGFTN